MSRRAFALGGLVVLALALRLPGVTTRSLWFDEAWRANILTAPTWAEFAGEAFGPGSRGIGAPMPPLFALLVRAVALLVGRSAVTLRALPLAASVAAVPLAYLVGRRCFRPGAGLIAAACFACYPAAVMFGQELKPYSTDVLTVLGLLLVAAGVVRRLDHPRSWAIFALAASLTPGLSYPAALTLPGIATGLLFGCRTRRHVVLWIGAHACAGLATLAWYLAVIRAQRVRPLTAAYWAGQFPPLDVAAAAPWVARQLLAFEEYAVGAPVLLFLVLAVVGYLLAPRWLSIAALLTLAAVVAAAVLRVYPLAGGRTDLFLLPFVYLPMGATLARLGTVDAAVSWQRTARFLRPALAVALFALPAIGTVNLGAALVREETASLIGELAAERRPGDRIYVYYGAVPAFRFYHPPLDDRIALGGSHRGDPSAYEAELRQILVPGERLWLLFSHVFSASAGRSERDVILSNLKLYGDHIATRTTEGASLHLFEVTRAPGTVRHIEIRPEDARDPGKLRELLGR